MCSPNYEISMRDAANLDYLLLCNAVDNLFSFYVVLWQFKDVPSTYIRLTSEVALHGRPGKVACMTT
jgi:hypothetical protein